MIRCEVVSDGVYTVRVSDAIGVVGLGDRQIAVEPKISMPHLLFLICQSHYLPRTAEIPTELMPDESFFTLVASWFVSACESALRGDLTRDYHGTISDLRTARGRVDCLATTRALLVGAPRVRCSYDTFGNDTSLNRLLRHALRAVQRDPVFGVETRRRARRADSRFSGVGEYRPSDLHASTDIRTKHYRDAATLARMLLTSQGATVLDGPIPGGTFLFRTPEAVEDGVRRLLQEELAPDWHIDKKGRTLRGAKPRTLNPDLVFNQGEAIGDVKYRVSSGLTRSDINQVTTFAAGYHAKRGLLIMFGSGTERDHVEVGKIRIDTINWDVHEPDPIQSARALATAVRHWLSGRSSGSSPITERADPVGTPQ